MSGRSRRGTEDDDGSGNGSSRNDVGVENVNDTVDNKLPVPTATCANVTSPDDGFYSSGSDDIPSPSQEKPGFFSRYNPKKVCFDDM
jgi:hypothetical protein